MKNKEKEVITDVKKFVVDRETWYRGKGSYHSCLLNKSNKMCCLGFYALACGLDKNVIRDITSPMAAVNLSNGKYSEDIHGQEVKRKSSKIWKTKLVPKKDNSAICRKLMIINDNKLITDEKREVKITRLFEKIGIQVKFK